ncbi:MAG TPA: class I SAM-dependent methyltransferase [Candidatus Paceibacterota bacterium]|nr:class I SAM-dependent methyltransferase [Candidatus Paceibacterota bacterium]
MANWYQKTVIPRLLNLVMGSGDFEKIRQVVLKDVSGIALEIGVGPGYNLPLYGNISKLYALEPSKELIEVAKTRADSLAFPIEFLNTGAESIPLLDQSIDTVVSTWTLCSVTDPRKVLQEIKRVLKPEGKFIFVDHGASPNIGIRTIQTILTTVTKYFTGNCHYDRQLEELIKEAGFAIEKIEHPQERFKPLIYNYRGIATPRVN